MPKNQMNRKTAFIIGAGPAGLTAALELLKRTGIKPIVLEGSGDIGGISKTVVHNGNRMDIGGHPFFSKSDWVMQWWQGILPIESAGDAGGVVEISYQNKKRTVELDKGTLAPGNPDKRMLIRSRLSRIYFLRRFFDYPIKLNLHTIRNLGAVLLLKIAASYFYIRRRGAPERDPDQFDRTLPLSQVRAWADVAGSSRKSTGWRR
mgnify:CR=1 FL=1